MEITEKKMIEGEIFILLLLSWNQKFIPIISWDENFQENRTEKKIQIKILLQVEEDVAKIIMILYWRK